MFVKDFVNKFDEGIATIESYFQNAYYHLI